MYSTREEKKRLPLKKAFKAEVLEYLKPVRNLVGKYVNSESVEEEPISNPFSPHYDEKGTEQSLTSASTATRQYLKFSKDYENSQRLSSRNLKIGLVTIIVGLLGGITYTHYTLSQDRIEINEMATQQLEKKAKTKVKKSKKSRIAKKSKKSKKSKKRRIAKKSKKKTIAGKKSRKRSKSRSKK